MNDNEIIDLFFDRNEKAIAALEKKHGRLFRRIANNILNNTSDAEECVNDAYFAVWNAIPPQRPHLLALFVSRIVRNISTTRYHHLTAEKRNSFYDTALDELLDCIPSNETADGDDSRALSDALNDFLETLSDEDCAMFMKRYWYSEGVAAIAHEYGQTPHYVSVRLSRIREKLRKFLEKRGIVI
jgi:RNA polymerase sigma-70 factor (ECF subfamily)